MAMLDKIKNLVTSLQETRTWTSVKQKPLSTLCENAGISKRDVPVILDILKHFGLIECTGQRSGMRYKFGEQEMYRSTDEVARKIVDYIDSNKINIRSYVVKGVKAAVFKPRVYSIGERVFYLVDTQIMEGYVIASEAVSGNEMNEEPSVVFEGGNPALVYQVGDYRVISLQGEITKASKVYASVDMLLDSLRKKYELYAKMSRKQ